MNDVAHQATAEPAKSIVRRTALRRVDSGVHPTVSFPALAPILLLLGSNVFMTFAWYGHLKFGDRSLLLVIVASWGIAFFEYCLAVPANRIGHAVYAPSELKVIQEVITLGVFAVFSVTYLGERLTWNHAAGFALICAGAWFVFDGPFGK